MSIVQVYSIFTTR